MDKVDKKKFSKLKQNDRIEYLLKYKIADDSGYKFDVTFLTLLAVLGLSGLIGSFIFSLTYATTGDSFFLNWVFVCLNLLKASFIFFFLSYGLETFLFIRGLRRRKNNLKELNEEYFKVEVKHGNR